MKKTTLYLLLLLFLYSCGAGSDVGKVLRNEKSTSKDEFLVKKRQPLTLPPDFENIPEPGSVLKKQKEKNENKIGELFKIPSDPKSGTQKSSSVEQSIINKIGK